LKQVPESKVVSFAKTLPQRIISVQRIESLSVDEASWGIKVALGWVNVVTGNILSSLIQEGVLQGFQ